MRLTVSSPRLRALTIAVGTAALALGSLAVAAASPAETPDGTGDSEQPRVVTPEVREELKELELAREEELDADGSFAVAAPPGMVNVADVGKSAITEPDVGPRTHTSFSRCRLAGFRACVWRNANFHGPRTATNWVPSGGSPWWFPNGRSLIRSAKNKYLGRRVVVADVIGGQIRNPRCIPKDTNAPGPFNNPRDVFKVGATGQNPNCN